MRPRLRWSYPRRVNAGSTEPSCRGGSPCGCAGTIVTPSLARLRTMREQETTGHGG